MDRLMWGNKWLDEMEKEELIELINKLYVSQQQDRDAYRKHMQTRETNGYFSLGFFGL